MARIIQLPKPVLEVSLISGGTLPINTTYYFTGYYKHGAEMYGSWFSPAADQVSVTTTSTHRTILLKWKYWNGSSYVYGIPADATSISIKWDYYSMINNATNKYYPWLNYNDPSAGTYSIAVGHRRWLTTYTSDILTGSQQIIATPTGLYDNTGNYNSQYRNHPEIAWNYHYTNYPVGFDIDKGTLGIVVQANDTFDTINNALMSITDKLYYCPKSSTYYTVQTDLIIVGSFWFTAAVVLKKYNIHIFSGSIHYQNANYAGGFENCTLMFTAAIAAYYRFFCYLKNCGLNTNSNSGYELSAINGYIENCNFNSSNANPFIVANDTLTNIISFTRLKWSFPQVDWFLQNITILENYIQIGAIATLLLPELYTESIKIVSKSAKTIYDIYFVNNIDGQVVRMRNFAIETDRPTSEGIDYSNDLKPRIYWGRTTIWTLVYDYLFKFIIKSQAGTPLVGANVTITNLLSSENYEINTNEDGIAITHCVTRIAQASGIVGYNTVWIDKEDFIITIDKEGYLPYIHKTYKVRQPLLFELSMTPIPEPVVIAVPQVMHVQTQTNCLNGIVEVIKLIAIVR